MLALTELYKFIEKASRQLDHRKNREAFLFRLPGNYIPSELKKGTDDEACDFCSWFFHSNHRFEGK